jgi:hypothetical protein
MSPAELGRHLRIPKGEATVFLAMLVREGKGKSPVELVELNTVSQDAARPRPTG